MSGDAIMADRLASTISPEVGRPDSDIQGYDISNLVICLSGGLDSSVVIGWYINERKIKPSNIYPLFVDYGQSWSSYEWTSAKLVADYWGTQPPKYTCRTLGVEDTIQEYDVNKRLKGYLPLRNLHIFSLASDYVIRLARQGIECDTFASGCRFSAYPDTTQEFLDRWNFMIKVSAWEGLNTEAPFAWCGTKRLYRYVSRLKFPIDKTTSCQVQTESGKRCGYCQKCNDREKYYINLST